MKPFITSLRFNAPQNTKILVAQTQKCVFIASLFLLHDICSSWVIILSVPKVKLPCWMHCLFYLAATGEKAHNLQFGEVPINPTGSYCSTRAKVSAHTSLLTCLSLSSIAIEIFYHPVFVINLIRVVLIPPLFLISKFQLSVSPATVKKAGFILGFKASMLVSTWITGERKKQWLENSAVLKWSASHTIASLWQRWQIGRDHLRPKVLHCVKLGNKAQVFRPAFALVVFEIPQGPSEWEKNTIVKIWCKYREKTCF